MSRSTYTPTVDYTGTGLLAVYTFPFKIEELSQLLVVEYDDAGLETQRVRGTDVTYLSGVVFDAVEGAGTVTLAANLTTDYKLILLLANDSPTQPTELKNKFDFTLKKFENALDWIAGAVARVAYLSQRSVKLSDYTDETAFDPTLPIEVTDAISQSIMTKADGTGFQIGPDISAISGAAASAAAAAVSAADSAAEAVAAAASAVAAATSTGYVKNTSGYADFSTAGLTVSITSFVLPAENLLEAIFIKHSQLFAAPGLTSLLISVGVVGDEGLFVDSFDVLQAVADQTFQIVDSKYIGSFASATNILVSAVAVGANLDTLTAGSVDVYSGAREVI